jgi:SAM-dependent methyltransferase
MNDLSQRALDMGPWRYNYRHDGVDIRSSNPASQDFDAWGRPMIKQLLAGLYEGRSVENLRVLDLGCLEGHITDVLCEMGFGEVVALDISRSHLERARFLLQDVRGYENVRVVEGNASDPGVASMLGRFDLVFFWGLLYHLKNPLQMFEVLEGLVNDPETFVLLLSTQYRGGFPFIVVPEAFGLIQGKPFRKAEAEEALSAYVFNPSDESAFEGIATRTNPYGVREMLRLHGYRGLLAYDDPSGHSYSFNSNLVVTKKSRPELVETLNRTVTVEGVRFYEWDGGSVNGYDFRRRPKAVIYRSVYRLVRGSFGIRAKEKAGIVLRSLVQRKRKGLPKG